MARKFQNILQTVGNTPVVKINKLAPPEANLYAKIEAFNPLGSLAPPLFYFYAAFSVRLVMCPDLLEAKTISPDQRVFR